MKILIACEFSGIVREAFKKLGHDAMSCDLLDTEIPGNHYKGDVMDIINKGWDMMIAHPPCTYMTNSGVRWLHEDVLRWDKLKNATDFFKKIWNAPIKKICIENPIMHKYAKEQIGITQSQVIQPWMFGHREQKATCLWLKNLPCLIQTFNVKKEMLLLPAKDRQKLHYLSPGIERWKERSRTFQGIADAMAEQWGSL